MSDVNFVSISRAKTHNNKDLIKLIFKQARKYGVACVLATQNVSDVDYKILAQANTTFIGRFTQPQDVEKVRHLLKESGGDQDLVAQLPTLGPGQFQMVAPDVDAAPVPIQCRWLYTDHGAPLNEDQVEDLISPEIRAWAKTRSSGKTKNRGAGAAKAASRGSNWNKGDVKEEIGLVEAARIKSIGGMTAAAHGVVDDSAFEVRLMGGLSVLKDGRDPLYTMQAAVNTASLAALAWTLVALMLAWRDRDLDWWWILAGAAITSVVGLVIALEGFLSHDTELLKKINQFARVFQLILVAWLWILVILSETDKLNLRGAQPLLEIVVVWVSLFTIIEFVNRFRLGKIRWNGGSALDKIVGLTAVLTDAQLTDMKSNSSQIMSGLRLILNSFTLVWLCVLIALSDGILPASSDISSGWGRPTLWLASLYGLIVISELWLRMRGRMPAEY